jgi:hypothetical protein
MDASKAKIARWLHPLCFAPDDGATPPDKLELRHVSVADKVTPVRAWSVAGADEDKIKSVSDQADQAAADDAEGVGGVQRYALVATAKGEPVGRLVLRYRAAEESDPNTFGDSEPTTERGMAARAQRHAEAAFRTMTAGAGGTIEMLARQNSKLYATVESMMTKQLEWIQLVEEMHSKKSERDLAAREMEAQIKVKEEIVGELVGLFPVLIKKFTGFTPAGYLPPEVKELRALAKGLSDEQIEGVLSHLRPEQQAVLTSVLQDSVEGEVKDLERKANGKLPT